jgi:O-succinylbenzoic acid--CoA ligase
MMIVRALAGNMQLVVVEPSGNPFKEIREIPSSYFIAIVPYQAYHILEENSGFPGTPKAVLIGGGNTDHKLIQKILTTNTPTYHSFGMTETVSHIALKRLDGVTAPDYKVLEGIEISLDNRGCLVIDAPDLNDNTLITNDLIEITGHNTFKWLGRYDLAINSGGIKIHPEQVEEKIEQLFSNLNIDNNFFISSIPDDKLGEKVVLIMENVETSLDIKTVLSYLSDNLPEYHCPKEILFLPEFEYTDTGKINRLKTRTQIL